MGYKLLSFKNMKYFIDKNNKNQMLPKVVRHIGPLLVLEVTVGEQNIRNLQKLDL